MDSIQKKAREKSLASYKDYKILFESDRGKKVLWDLMKTTDFLGPSHVIGDSHTTAFNDGQKNVVRHILKKIKTDYKKLEAKIQEGIEDESRTWE